MIARHIEVNKEALSDDLKEAAEQIEDLKAALEEKRREKQLLLGRSNSVVFGDGADADGADDAFDEAMFEGCRRRSARRRSRRSGARWRSPS